MSWRNPPVPWSQWKLRLAMRVMEREMRADMGPDDVEVRWQSGDNYGLTYTFSVTTDPEMRPRLEFLAAQSRATLDRLTAAVQPSPAHPKPFAAPYPTVLGRPPVDGHWQLTQDELDLCDLKPGDILGGFRVGPPRPDQARACITYQHCPMARRSRCDAAQRCTGEDETMG